ncbi:MAG TPA: bifunctional hydroxymethylpyrimidine kinase/phosphomethylpyrimidine kinase [Planctomycetota bacterium]|nr:bifunctional hydroxymethylpyrimidine kinase/phosphomethylpyrimidine kinase [Planctomycetota bacterium]
MDTPSEPPVVLVVAGLDPTGRAGLAADLRALAALGVHGAPVATCLTDQSNAGLHAMVPVDGALVSAQLASVLADLPVAAVKVGLVASSEVARALASCLAAYPELPAVIDPVLATSTGDSLLDEAARVALLSALVPRAHVLTPNLDEADALLGLAPGSARSEPLASARALLALGPRAVLLKGGHGRGEQAVDLWLDADGAHELALPRLAGRTARGTGCTLASALAAGLAHGLPGREAARRAKQLVHDALFRAPLDGPPRALDVRARR